jgi:FrmR/RcnR family transcriptional regulator, repressor of frmRAB operon
MHRAGRSCLRHAHDLVQSGSYYGTRCLQSGYSRCQESRKRIAKDRLRIPSRVYYIFTRGSYYWRQKKLINRVRRLQGQIDAVEKAIHEEQDCGRVLQLIAAARCALNSLMAEILEGHIRFHIVNPDGKPKSKQAGAARELIAVVRTYLK